MIRMRDSRTAGSKLRKLSLLSAAALLSGLTACSALRTSDASVSRDRILWARAVSAYDHQRCDVGRLTLQTLINTYPDSKYATEAARRVRDPAIAGCKSPDDLWVVGGSDMAP